MNSQGHAEREASTIDSMTLPPGGNGKMCNFCMNSKKINKKINKSLF